MTVTYYDLDNFRQGWNHRHDGHELPAYNNMFFALGYKARANSKLDYDTLESIRNTVPSDAASWRKWVDRTKRAVTAT